MKYGRQNKSGLKNDFDNMVVNEPWTSLTRSTEFIKKLLVAVNLTVTDIKI